MPLTADRAKPAVPFGGIYRLIDFALSNLVNSGYLQIVVLTQYKSHSLDRHISKTWRMSTLLGNYVTPVPAQQRVGKNWYLGSADAIFQSLNLIHDEKPDIVVVVGADHVYRMDFCQMVEPAHRDRRRRAPSPRSASRSRSPTSSASSRSTPTTRARSRRSCEKPKDPKGLPDSPDEVLASMGNYVFDADALIDAVTRDADARGQQARHGRRHRARLRRAAARPTSTTSRTTTCPGRPTATATTGATSGRIDSYFEAHMDLVSIHPVFNLYNYEWPIYTDYGPYPPAKFVHGCAAAASARRSTRPSPPACVVSGATRRRTRCSRRACTSTAAPTIDDSVLLDGVDVGRHAVVQRAILDKNVVVPEGASIGVDREARPGPRLPRHRVGHHRRRQGPGGHRVSPEAHPTTPLSAATRVPCASASSSSRSTPTTPRSAGPSPRPRRSASTSCSTGTTSSRCTASRTASTSSAGRCSAPGPRRPSGSRSARWSPATATATPSCSPTWPAPSTTSATAG